MGSRKLFQSKAGQADPKQQAGGGPADLAAAQAEQQAGTEEERRQCPVANLGSVYDPKRVKSAKQTGQKRYH